MDWTVEDMNTWLLEFFVGAVVIYGIVLLLGIWGNTQFTSFIRNAVGQYRVTIGIPVSAFASYAIVVFLLRIFPQKEVGGELVMKFAGQEFTGPMAPVTLWVLCFLSFVFAMWLLEKK